MAHDLLNPLAAVKGITQLVLRQIERRTFSFDIERLQADMHVIEAAATKAANQVEASLAAVRARSSEEPELNLAPADLVELAEEAIDESRGLSPHHRVVLATDEPFIRGFWDRDGLLRVLTNLLGNAIKFSPDGGTVTVALRVEQRSMADWAVADVSDEGIGIPDAAIPRIFDRFYRAENAANVAGTGLGLTGVQQIIRAHGGTVHVESVEGQGSVFTVALPLTPVGATSSEVTADSRSRV